MLKSIQNCHFDQKIIFKVGYTDFPISQTHLLRFRHVFFATCRNMFDDFAKEIFLATHSSAGINTIIVWTGFSFSTIFISLTFSLKTEVFWWFIGKVGNTEWITYFGTRDFRISNESWRTFTCKLSSETNRFTNSIGATWIGITRVRSFYTLLVFANVTSLTIRINLKKKMVWNGIKWQEMVWKSIK